jgi:hypothetical protein
MPRKSNTIAAIYETVPASIPPPAECGGMMCMNLECRQCWGVLDELSAIFEPTPGVAVDLDEATYAALQVAASRQGTTVCVVAKAVLRRWAARK